MGYSYHLESNKEITEAEVQEIVDQLPPGFRGAGVRSFGLNPNQSWGWSLACDVHKPHGTSISIGGSHSMSGKEAPSFVQHFIDELINRGHTIQWTYSD